MPLTDSKGKEQIWLDGYNKWVLEQTKTTPNNGNGTVVNSSNIVDGRASAPFVNNPNGFAHHNVR